MSRPLGCLREWTGDDVIVRPIGQTLRLRVSIGGGDDHTGVMEKDDDDDDVINLPPDWPNPSAASIDRRRV